jgi:vacuolar-type H+-ATPase subunit D/Vma8
MKGKLKGAQIGHDLLKRKSEALTKCASPLPLALAELTAADAFEVPTHPAL